MLARDCILAPTTVFSWIPKSRLGEIFFRVGLYLSLDVNVCSSATHCQLSVQNCWCHFASQKRKTPVCRRRSAALPNNCVSLWLRLYLMINPTCTRGTFHLRGTQQAPLTAPFNSLVSSMLAQKIVARRVAVLYSRFSCYVSIGRRTMDRFSKSDTATAFVSLWFSSSNETSLINSLNFRPFLSRGMI